MRFRGGEFSTGTTGNFQPELTLGLSAGANAGVFNAATLGKGTSDIAVNGQSTSQNNVQIDGSPSRIRQLREF